jgi:hypothetical protein
VRDQHRPEQLDYACDGAGWSRIFHLVAYPLPDRCILLQHTVVFEAMDSERLEHAIAERYRGARGMIVQALTVGAIGRQNRRGCGNALQS